VLFVNKKHCPVLRIAYKKYYSPNTALNIASCRKIACAGLTHTVLAKLMMDNVVSAKFSRYGHYTRSCALKYDSASILSKSVPPLRS